MTRQPSRPLVQGSIENCLSPACQANTFCQHQFNRTLKRKEKLRGHMHALPPSLGKMEALHSPFAKIYFTKPPGSLPARAKQRGLENQRTNQPKQPTESKEREAPRCKWSQPPSSSVLSSPAQCSSVTSEDNSIPSLLAFTATPRVLC